MANGARGVRGFIRKNIEDFVWGGYQPILINGAAIVSLSVDNETDNGAAIINVIGYQPINPTPPKPSYLNWEKLSELTPGTRPRQTLFQKFKVQ